MAVDLEHIGAVNNLETIFAVDGFIVGPYDLAEPLGVPGQFDHPLMKEAMQQIETVGKASGKALGIHVIGAKSLLNLRTKYNRVTVL